MPILGCAGLRGLWLLVVLNGATMLALFGAGAGYLAPRRDVLSALLSSDDSDSATPSHTRMFHQSPVASGPSAWRKSPYASISHVSGLFSAQKR